MLGFINTINEWIAERQGFAEGEMVEEKPTVQPLLSQSGIVQDDPTVQDELTKRTIGGSKSYIQS